MLVCRGRKRRAAPRTILLDIAVQKDVNKGMGGGEDGEEKWMALPTLSGVIAPHQQ